eukprot:CAMPEP_0181433942 /NCGR_PEP_ID=MMETSP1110-20121109/19561_1 /TAXON_ID=174948 /ORGANISM="Symbiodinium sp., Strain CCMP421" /LENGTH=598 /DNA_ID=CAMNT_0023557429 /DNA_START=33 /DNA_END=1829 /DNA_ORIENTATION=-
MMKLLLLAICPALLVHSAKVRASRRQADSAVEELEEDKNPCPKGLTNRYPASLPKEVVLVDDENGGAAMNPMDSVFDLEKLRAALKEDPEWKIGMPWILKATFSSDSKVDRKFGFSSGGADGGFLEITVPAGCQEKDIQVFDEVELSGAEVEFQYMKPTKWTSGKIVISGICLAPRSCDNFDCPAPAMKKKGKGLFGFSSSRCCDFRTCTEIPGVCEPATMYDKAPKFEKKHGHDNSTCCLPKYCKKDLCANDTKWVDKGDLVLGSTKEECCETQECASYTCSQDLMRSLPKLLEDGSARLGSTDEECCEGEYCQMDNYSFDCGPAEDYGLVANASNVLGNSKEKCCDVKKCDTYKCPDNTTWEPNPKAVVGSTIEQCCTKKMCDTYTCSKDSLQKTPVKGLQGSTDEECCETKFCTAWTCSDKTKWVHKSAQHGKTNLDRRGFSDEECCDEKYCLEEICDPATQWKGKEGLDKIQGSTHEQCCEKIFCDDFVCDTDVNGTGVGTQWYKRVDTNTYKWQGSTNEECCMPIYCSQYTTSHPTRWVRKKDASLHGSTDVECYDPLWCSEYCCDKQSGLELRPNAKQHQGSTDEECCVKIG